MQKQNRIVAALLAAGVLLSLSTPAAAVPIHVTAGGFFPEQGSPLVADGTEWSLDLVYESSVPDLTPGLTTEGLYAAYLSLSLTIGNQVYSLSDFDPDRTRIQIFNDRVSAGGTAFRDAFRFTGGFAGTTLNFNLATAFGYDQPGGPLNSDALLSDPAALTALFHNQQDPGWEFTDFIYFDIPSDETTTADFAVGTIDRFTASAQSVAVAEPATLSMLSLGLLMMFGLRRRHQR